jgi:hypothetical protein
MVLNPSAASRTCLSALRPNPSHATTAVNPKIRESAKTPRTILSGQATSAINAADRKRLMVCQNFTTVLFVRGKPLIEFLIRLRLAILHAFKGITQNLRLGLLRCLLFAHGDHRYERVPEAGFRPKLAVVNGYGDWMSAAEKRCVRVFLRPAATPAK